MADHAGHAHPGVRPLGRLVVVAALPGRVAPDGLARDRVPGHALRVQGVRAGDRHDRVDLVGIGDRPLQAPASRRASHRPRPRAARSRARAGTRARVRTMSATVITGKSEPYGVPVAGSIDDGPGRAAAAAEQVGADHEVVVGVEGLAGIRSSRPTNPSPGPPYRRAPRHRTRRGCSPPVGVGREAGRVGVAAERVADQDDVVAGRGEGPVGLVGDPDGWSSRPQSSLHRLRQVEVTASRPCPPMPGTIARGRHERDASSSGVGILS